LAVLAVFSTGTASAQTTINQTTCFNSGGLCPNPRQNLTVDCSTGGNINNTLAQITDRNGPNTINVSGTCPGQVSVVGFNRLTIQGSATIANRVNITNSRTITLKGLTLSGTPAVPVAGLVLNGSDVLLDGVTVQNFSSANGINVDNQSVLGFAGVASLITGNALSGIEVGSGSRVNVANVTVSNNGAQAGSFAPSGIFATDGASLVLANQINGVDAPVDIFGNAGTGIRVKGGTLTMLAQSNPNSLVHIHDNGGIGLEIGGHAEITGPLKLDGNNPAGGNLGGLFPMPLQVLAGEFLEMGNGVEVQGNLAAVLNTVLIIGDSGPMTITGSAMLAYGSTGFVASTNSIGALTCDNTSWAAIVGQPIQTNTCPGNGVGILSITAGNGITSTGGQTPSLSLDTGLTDARYLQLGGGTLTGGLTATGFAGNGAGLTNVDAATFGGLLPSKYARLDTANTFAGIQSVTGSLLIGGGTAISQHLSATYNISLPSLKANTCTNLTEPLNGAVSGGNDSIALGVPSSLMSAGGFLMFQAWESAPNTITVRACNVNPIGPASSAVSGTIRVDLWKH
jgi:hypothetical protein